MPAAKNRYNVFERIESVKEVLRPFLSVEEMERIKGMMVSIMRYRLGKDKSLSEQNSRVYEALLKNGYNPKTVYSWLLLENVPQNIRRKLEKNEICLKAARYEFVKWKKMNYKNTSSELMEDMRMIIGGLAWESHRINA